jgi:chemotaxis protein CheC
MAPDEKTQMDALSKLVTQGTKSGVEVLMQMLGADIVLDVPTIAYLDSDGTTTADISAGEVFTVVAVGFDGRLKGNSGLFFEASSTGKFVGQVAGDDADEEEINFIAAGVLTELGNIVLNRVMGAISNALQLSLDYVVPDFYQGELSRLWQVDAARDPLDGLLVRTRFEVSDMETNGQIAIFFEKASFQSVADKIDALSSGG